MWDFLAFNTFAAQNILISFYYIGAIFVPMVLWFFRYYFIQNSAALRAISAKFDEALGLRKKIAVAAGLFVLFVCAQICWRIVFEIMIGYFDMHDYLYELSKNAR